MINFIHSVGYGCLAFLVLFIFTACMVRNHTEKWKHDNAAGIFCVCLAAAFITFCITY